MSVGSVPPHRHVNCVRNVTFRRIDFTRPFKAIYVKTETAVNDGPSAASAASSDDTTTAASDDDAAAAAAAANDDEEKNASGVIDGVTYESITITDPRWIPVYVGPQQMLHITTSSGGSCMADPLACTTEPKVAITNLVLRDVAIRAGCYGSTPHSPHSRFK